MSAQAIKGPFSHCIDAYAGEYNYAQLVETMECNCYDLTLD